MGGDRQEEGPSGSRRVDGRGDRISRRGGQQGQGEGGQGTRRAGGVRGGSTWMICREGEKEVVEGPGQGGGRNHRGSLYKRTTQG